MQPVDLTDAFRRIPEPWRPRLAGELNGQHVRLVRLVGEFVWHQHELEDELFLVHAGRMRIEFRDRSVALAPGQFLIVPRGVEHRPVAEPEAEVLLFEPAGTLNTGDQRNDRTVDSPERL